MYLISLDKQWVLSLTTDSYTHLRMHDPVYAQYYAKKKAEPKQFAHKRALALTARKLVRLVFFLLKTNQLYQPEGGNRQNT